MEEVKFEQTNIITKYKTADGGLYDRKDEAEIHEKYLELRKKAKELKFVNGAFYCHSQADFELIVDYLAHREPFYNYNSGRVEPRYGYSYNDYQGPDWYFFRYEYCNDGPDEYWVETLSEKKAEWDEFYEQYELE